MLIRRIKGKLKRIIMKILQKSSSSHMVSEKHILMAQKEASKLVIDFYKKVENNHGNRTTIVVDEIVNDFFNLYPKRPIQKNIHGSGFENMFWLFVSARYLQPDLIIESGVWRGQTTWILRSACPDAEIHSFDIDLSNRVFVDDKVHYHESDWNDCDFGNIKGRNTFCFFDDHESHAKRINEASRKGFKTITLDDNLPAYFLFCETSRIAPTVDMIFDETIADGEKIEWLKNGESYSHTFSHNIAMKTRKKIKTYSNFPLVDYEALYASTKARFGGKSKTAFIQLY